MSVSSREPIAVIGTGYVGLVTAAGFAELGNEVWCVDIDAAKVERLRRGEIPIYEPGLAESVAANAHLIHFTTDLAPALARARLLFVAVGTPPTYSGDADLSAVNAVIGALPVSGEHAVVMKSTVPVGTGRKLRRTLEETGRGAYSYVSCPEFLKEGAALDDFRHPDRVVVGDGGDWGGDAVVELYAPLGAPVVRTDIASAEMIKLAANAFLATKISFINEIANVCEETGADVLEVAAGMGLDKRIGPHFLKPGLGFGGSCLLGDETVLVRHHGRTTQVTFQDLWRRLERDHEVADGVIEPRGLEVLSYVPGQSEPLFLPVMCATRRAYDGPVVQVRTKMGRRVTTTVDHPWLVSDGHGGFGEVKEAGELTSGDWVPLSVGGATSWDATKTASLLTAVSAVDVNERQLIVRAGPEAISRTVGQMPATASTSSTASVSYGGQTASTLALDAHFWRVVGLYIAEGCVAADGARRRIKWSFHPSREQHLADEVAAYWLRHGVKASVRKVPTALNVDVSSRILASWWTTVLGLGKGSYFQRLPDLIWERQQSDRWALLSGLFEGDGSWSLVNGGPSIEFGTVSDELADGVLRLLASVGIVASRRIGRVAKSTKDTHWIRIAGADQVERAILLVPERDRPGVLASIARQQKRIAPTGYRQFDGDATAWVRVKDTITTDFSGDVYSLEVPYAHTFVTSGGVAVHNCFPKDVTALKQIAGNTGYHFQLLTSVIEVNELQKRRVIGKLQKYLGPLVGKKVALLGLAFKAQTDDMREASSLVLAARLQADGAHVRAYDPIAMDVARTLMPGVEFADSALEAVAGVDAIVLVTEWPEFRELDWEQVGGLTAGKVLIDGRNFIDGPTAQAAGFAYEGIGR